MSELNRLREWLYGQHTMTSKAEGADREAAKAGGRQEQGRAASIIAVLISAERRG